MLAFVIFFSLLCLPSIIAMRSNGAVVRIPKGAADDALGMLAVTAFFGNIGGWVVASLYFSSHGFANLIVPLFMFFLTAPIFNICIESGFGKVIWICIVAIIWYTAHMMSMRGSF
ncbi:MAG: hypothetical protein OEY58_19505 [Gammaproteobacteria bacterium]|nr:hypothetical protein [Gammaproteobacteria bacterium]